MYDEGVIKFTYRHENRDLPADIYGELTNRLIAWRRIMSETALVGRDPARYGGAAYGNLSGRMGPFPGQKGERRFVISGTATGGKDCVSARDFCVVDSYAHARNFVVSKGPIEPSSESMTHGSIYDLDARIRFVFHAHTPMIWQRARELNIPMSRATVPYGTPEMAMEVTRLYRQTHLADAKILAMGGHEDGIIVFGESAEEVGGILLKYLARAYEKQAEQDGLLCKV